MTARGQQQEARSSTAVLIPIKAFSKAKARLSSRLDATERATLALSMANHMINAQRGLDVYICCDDQGVAAWADSVGAQTIWTPRAGLNASVQAGVDAVRADGKSEVAVAHADLPLATSLASVFGWPGVTLIPDRHRSGTNVIAFPTMIPFRFSFGIASFHRHLKEAVLYRRGVRLVHDRAFGFDVDSPQDLDILHRSCPGLGFSNETRE